MKTYSLLPTALAAALVLAPAVLPQAIVIDHNCTDLSLVPAYWIDQAKNLKLHYAHTSHGGQVVTGIEVLEGIDTYYSVAVGYCSLPAEAGALCIFDGQEDEDYIEPGDYWENEEGRQHTRDVIDHNPAIQYSMWAWCGQVSGSDESYIGGYLSVLDAFETEYPGKRFIYMTGHLDGSGSSGNLHLRNQQIRDYCVANGKILFDFADLERYDPAGADYLDLDADDGCYYWREGEERNWAVEWCAGHPGDDRCAGCGSDDCCAHSEPLNCNQKARAFWWLMARLAGWSGQTGPPTPSPVPSPTPLHARPGGGDYDGDGTSDPAVFRPSSGLWSVRSLTRFYFGGSSDLPVPSDFRGDGTAVPAVFRPATGLWSVRALTRFYLGSSDDWALPGAYGSGASAAVFRPATGLWSVRDLTRLFFGAASSLPVPADYDGDGTAEIAVFQPALSRWAIRGLTALYFGQSSDEPVPSDGDGDGTVDPAVFRPSTGFWAFRSVTGIYFGGAGDRPVPGGYGGPGAASPAIFRPATGLWSVRSLTRFFLGSSSDLPASR